MHLETVCRRLIAGALVSSSAAVAQNRLSPDPHVHLDRRTVDAAFSSQELGFRCCFDLDPTQ